MEARPQTIRQVFLSGGDVQYLLPHFQREYTWERDDWQTLFEDLIATCNAYHDGGPKPEHFMGSLVRVDNGTQHGIPTYALVDGQQRLTTISLLLCAIRAEAGAEDSGARRIGRMLVNTDEAETAPSRYKLVPTTKHGDRAAYIAALSGSPVANAASGADSNITPAYAFLRGRVRDALASEVDPQTLYDTVLECFQVVTIDLKGDEQPYKIFESLNGKGKPLTPADLVRNYVAMTLPPQTQERVFLDHWAPIDDLLQEKREVGSSGYGELTGFLRHYLAMRARALYDRDHLYERFRDRTKGLSTSAFVDELAAMHRFATYYDRLLRPDHEPDAATRAALTRLQTFEMTTAFPFLLRVYDARDIGEMTPAAFLDLLTVLENYAVRRFLCGRQANYLNKMFPLLWEGLNTTDLSASLRQSLATRQYPTDTEVRDAVRARKAYDQRNARRLTFVFDAVNRFLSSGSGGYTVLDADPSFEHIMPQTLTAAWKTELGPDWEAVHGRLLHTLGNLTVVTQGWNASLSNEPFATKRKRLRANGLRLNSDYFARDIPHWDEAAMLARADWLADATLAIWPALVAQPQPSTRRFSKPVSVIIAGQTYRTDTWRNVFFTTAEVVSVRWGEAVAEQVRAFPHLFAQECPAGAEWRFRQLSNGWWLHINWSAESVKTYCRKLILSAGLRESDWQVEEA